MNTALRYLLAVAIIVSSAAGFVGALGLLAFVGLRVAGVDGASWSSAGWMLILLGASAGALVLLDKAEGKL